MRSLLALSRLIDGLNDRVGRLVYWAILAAVVISTGNALVRKILDTSSNAFLEVQWYLFSAVFLLCAGYALLHNQHVRIDIVVARFSRRTLAWIEIFGTVFFLAPMAILILYLSIPVAARAWVSEEVSTNAGGLPLWPARVLVPMGFALLVLQGVSELIKRIAFLRGLIPDPSDKGTAPSAEEQLAAEIRRQQALKGAPADPPADGAPRP